ncbi:hypothetical protein B0H63DRAFT_515247 [Podospora didyma]|uniref:Uncharacterized protein n=1 Tax=Podospora didyma TaxID=330526 RepID=A0AAE0K242_9PEZI|nr:hypothetical protein B0H63DRAFT_515247 [Podospora didyma]
MSTDGAVTLRTLAAFDPPGHPYVDDGLTAPQKLSWSKEISSWMQAEITAQEPDPDHPGKTRPVLGPKNIPRTPLAQFFNGTITAFDVDQEPVAITWIGFPNLVKTTNPNVPQRWKLADATRDVQDEYLEWSVKKDTHGNVISVTFTCEGPEYWDFLSQQQPDTVVKLYQAMNPDFKSQIKKSDLFPGGRYRRDNKWNSTTTSGTIAHLVQGANTLSAEVDIAAQGTVIRKRDDAAGTIITDKIELINCSGYGQPKRNSDPTIGDAINSLARKGLSVSVANPVAIYMHSFNTGNFQLDVEGTGENMVDVPAGTFRWQRGNIAKNMGLRLQIKIPDGVLGTGESNKGKQLTVSDIVDTKNGQNIRYGAQFADYITMTVKGVAISGGKPDAARLCPYKAAKKTAAAAVLGLVGESVATAEGVETDDLVATEEVKPCDASANSRRANTRW